MDKSINIVLLEIHIKIPQMKKFCFFLLTFITATHLCSQNSLPLRKLSIFKNNTAMLVREGLAPVVEGKVSVPVPSHAIYGTLFLGTTKENQIKEFNIVNDTIKKKENALAVWQLIAGNVGKTATISFSPAQRADHTISGKITSYNLQSGLVQMKEDNGKTACIHSTDIYQVEFSEEYNTNYFADSVQRSLVFVSPVPGDKIPLEEIYLQTGLNWMPSYFLKLKDDKTAHLEMKATIENFSEAINEGETELIVGAPQMINSGKPDPITYDFETNESNLYPGGGYAYSNSNAMQAKAIYYGAAAPALEDRAFENNFSTEGEKNGDLYIYKIGKVNIGKNAKAIYPIFAGNVQYKDKYEGTIADKSNDALTQGSGSEESTIDVYHSIELTNTSPVPLTTAPVTIINDKEQFVAQDELTYTPVGAPVSIRLSKAIDLIMKNAEEETGRTDNAKKVGKKSYSSIKLRGTITIENFQEKEVPVCATKEMSGEVISSSDNGRIIKHKGAVSINPQTQIKWDLKIAAKQKKIITYEYEVFYLPN